MEIALLIVSILLIAIVLLQSGKAEAASQIIQGGNSDLFSNRKERGRSHQNTLRSAGHREANPVNLCPTFFGAGLQQHASQADF